MVLVSNIFSVAETDVVSFFIAFVFLPKFKTVCTHNVSRCMQCAIPIACFLTNQFHSVLSIAKIWLIDKIIKDCLVIQHYDVFILYWIDHSTGQHCVFSVHINYCFVVYASNFVICFGNWLAINITQTDVLTDIINGG